QVSVDFDVWFASLSAAGDTAPIRLTPPAFPGMDVYYFANPSGAYFQEYGDDYSAALATPALSTWHHISITIVTNGTTSTIDASIDGTAGWTGHTLKHPWPTPTTAIVEVGLADLYGETNGEAYVDNVVVRVQ